MKIIIFSALFITLFLFNSFNQLIAAEPIENEKILFLTASWCGPCHTFKTNEVPKLQSDGYVVSKKLYSTIRILDVEDDLKILKKYQLKPVTSLPTFVYIRMNKEVDRLNFVGIVTSEQVNSFYWRNKNGANK